MINPHGRGRRPYLFTYDGHIDNVPGAKAWNGKVQAAVDCAWIVAQQADLLAGQPWPGPNHAYRQAAIERAKHLGAYDFQLEGAAFLAERDYGLLADEMGLGKTMQALVAAEVRLNIQPRQFIIVCPALAKNNWSREITRWTGHMPAIIDGLKPLMAVPSNRYIICNYDILYGQRRRDEAGKFHEVEALSGHAKTLAGLNPLGVIFDEAHNLRGKNSRRTDAARTLCKNVEIVWALTATPILNHVKDIWALWDIISNGLAGPFWNWAKRYANAHQSLYGWTANGEGDLDELRKRLAFWCLGRAKSAVELQLPEKRRDIQFIDVSSPSDVMIPFDRNNNGKQNLVALRVAQAARQKHPCIVEMAREALSARQKIIIGCYMRETAHRLAQVLVFDHKVFCVTGDMTAETRDKQSEVFRSFDGPCAFVCTIDSVSHAISLVGADLVIVADLSWDPMKLLQFEGRSHRIGSGKSVIIRYVIAKNTVDEHINETVISKLAMIEKTLGLSGDGMSGQLGGAAGVPTQNEILDELFKRLTA